MTGATVATVLWQRLDSPGHDSARLSFESPHWRIAGAAIFERDRRPCRLDYVVVCDAAWSTRSARVTGWFGDELVDVELSVDAASTWRMNGVECPAVGGCIDVDLHFTPATNTLPIRRLELAVGRESVVRAAWLSPEFSMTPLEQVYRRADRLTYGYESDGGRFTAKIEVNNVGLVTSYEGLWKRIA
ncbi:MAG: putative glycolipid-binding domain-containing protein [Gemmatimonadota bacterium]|nr:putative glycolipid-binding domain-containing protein [Gemmatimonadota bacterium]